LLRVFQVSVLLPQILHLVAVLPVGVVRLLKPVEAHPVAVVLLHNLVAAVRPVSLVVVHLMVGNQAP